jgi:hypothetical protein
MNVELPVAITPKYVRQKCTIALFGDLARRMAFANPQRSNPLEGFRGSITRGADVKRIIKNQPPDRFE